jgi:BASS family bile acid:Na+ symporter
MDFGLLVLVSLVGGIVLTVVSLGLEAEWGNARVLLQQPALFLRSLLAMYVLAPVVACAVAAAFDLRPAVKIALVTLSLSPLPPFLPKKEMTAGGQRPYVVSLLTLTALVAVVFIPLALELLQAIFGLPLDIAMLRIARSVAISVLLPLVIAMTVHSLSPSIAHKLVRPVASLAIALLVVGVVAVLVKLGPNMWELIGKGTLVAMIAFAVVATAIGHLLGGPLPGNRAALALATSARHPGVAMAIAAANFPDQNLVLPAILVYTIISTAVSIPYLRKIGASQAAPAGAKA